MSIFAEGLIAWSAAIRRGELSFETSMQTCLERVGQESRLDAWEAVDANRALATASALDRLLGSGIDLGPLMGAPIGVKDIIAVNGFITRNGSNANTDHLVGGEGPVIQRLHRGGIIVLGKTRTVEFALGATGVNRSRGTPKNSADRHIDRIPGGSSSGSAVAVAADMVPLALGSDTGGSVRIPAALNGIVGHKTTIGRWSTDGVFPLSPSLDTLGPLCRCVDDAVLVHELICRERVHYRTSVAGLRFGVPESLFFDDLDDTVGSAFEQASALLVDAGAIRVDFDFPAVGEGEELFDTIVPAELLSTLTPEYFLAIRDRVDPGTARRMNRGLEVTANDYLRAQRRRQELKHLAYQSFSELDCWLTPTCPFLAPPISSLEDQAAEARALLASRNTKPVNLFDCCALTLPVPGSELPVGLQLMMPAGEDARLLSTGRAIEHLLASIG